MYLKINILYIYTDRQTDTHTLLPSLLYVNPTGPIITLNVNGLNAPTHQKTEIVRMDQNARPNCLPSIRNLLYYKDTYRLKVNRWKKFTMLTVAVCPQQL